MPRSRPKDFLVNPRSFGRYLEVRWLDDIDPAEHDLCQAAEWQHLVVVGVYDALQYRGLAPEDLAQEIGISRERMWRYLRGEVLMSLTHFATIQRFLNVRLVRPSSDAERRAGTDVEPLDKKD